MVRQDCEMSNLQHVAEVPHGLVDCQELSVVGTVLFVVPGSASWRRWRGLPDALNSLLKDCIHGGV